MIQSVEIQGLRGIREGKLEGLTPLIVLVGPNGCGKSTVLEALLIGGSTEPEKAIGYVAVRRRGIKHGYEWLITGTSQLAATTPFVASITVATDAECVRSLRFLPADISIQNNTKLMGRVYEVCGGEATSETDLSVNFLSGMPVNSDFWGRSLKGASDIRILEPEGRSNDTPLHTLYTQAVKNGRRDEVTALLRDVVRGLSHIEILTEEDAPIIHLVFPDHSLPVALAGDGIYTLLNLCLELTTRANGVVLLEEPEVHKHPGAIQQSARAIWAAIRRGIQVIISTHSLELIDSLLSETENQNELEQLTLYRLQLREGCLQSYRMPGSEVSFARTEIEDDLR